MLILTDLNDIWLSLGSSKVLLPLQNSQMDPHFAQCGQKFRLSRYLGKKMPTYQYGIKTKVLMLILTNLNDSCLRLGPPKMSSIYSKGSNGPTFDPIWA